MREPCVAIVENTDLDLTQDALEYRREAVHRDQQCAPSLRAPSLQQPLDAVVIRLKNLASPRVALFLRQIVIAGDQRQLADDRDRCRETGLTVAIDDEPRISLQHGRGIKRLGETLGAAG